MPLGVTSPFFHFCVLVSCTPKPVQSTLCTKYNRKSYQRPDITCWVQKLQRCKVVNFKWVHFVQLCREGSATNGETPSSLN